MKNFAKSFPKIFLVFGYITVCLVITSRELMWGVRELPQLPPWPSPYHFYRAAAEEVSRPSLLDGRSCSIAGLGVSSRLAIRGRSWSCSVRKFHNFWGWDISSLIAKHGADTLSQLVTRQRLVQRACVLSSSEGWEGQDASTGNTSFLPSNTV